MDNFESIKVRNVHYKKPVAVVINPNSGKKIDKIGRISSYLRDNDIPFEIHATQKAGDSFTIPLELDLDRYSALISCGGDGTLFEVVNGMLERSDGKKLPIGVIPNGSGNAGAGGLGIRDTDMALEAIKSQTAIKHDLFRVIYDTEDNSSIPKGAEAFKTKRAYSAVGVIVTDTTFMENAKPFKPYFGNAAYPIAFLYQMCVYGMPSNNYTISVDDKEIKNLPGLDNARTPSFSIFHCNKLPSYPINFPGVINDGLMVLNIVNAEMTFKYLGEYDKRCKAGVAESYTGNYSWYRGTKAIIKAHSTPLRKLSVDGEDIGHYKDYACVEVLPGEVEFLFNAD